MWPRSHWTPRYIKDRISEEIFRRRNPSAPWLTQTSIRFLDEWLCARDRALEFGSGRSTSWLARRVGHLTSVEHNPEWFNRVEERLRDERIPADRVDYRFAPGGRDSYVGVALELKSQSLDFLLVDGVFRGLCAVESLRLLKAGGLLVIDNANWFVPSDSRSPQHRDPEYLSLEWQSFLAGSANWRRVATSNGVTDTHLYFRPPGS